MVFNLLRISLLVLVSGFVACTDRQPAQANTADKTPADKTSLNSSSAFSASISSTYYCALAQQRMVDSKLPVSNIIHTDFDAFVKSKPSLQPLTSHQYQTLVRFEGKQQAMPAVISCKFKSADALNKSTSSGEPAKQSSCATLIKLRLSALRAELGRSVQLHAEKIRIDHDATAMIGPRWLNPWPFVPASMVDGQTVLRGKALSVPHDSLIPMPKRFKGTFYCHLPSDEYLTALLVGELSADDKFVLAKPKSNDALD